MPSRYETDVLLNEYLHFHYSSGYEPLLTQLQLNLPPFPVRCVTDCLDIADLPRNATALDLGCAVGRSSFELARHCRKVTAVDLSHKFIEAAKHIQAKGELPYTIVEEGSNTKVRIAFRPTGIDHTCIDFRCDDVMNILKEKEQYDVILAANLLCRLPRPKEFLENLAHLAKPSAQLIIVSPYSWLEEFTEKQNWLTHEESDENPLKALECILSNNFGLEKTFDLPFLIREHARKFQLGISQATVWRKKEK